MLCFFVLFVFVLYLVCPISPVSIDCRFLIPSVFSNVYLIFFKVFFNLFYLDLYRRFQQNIFYRVGFRGEREVKKGIILIVILVYCLESTSCWNLTSCIRLRVLYFQAETNICCKYWRWEISEYATSWLHKDHYIYHMIKWFLFNAKWASIQVYHGENKLLSMRWWWWCRLCTFTRPTYFIVLVHWNNSSEPTRFFCYSLKLYA